MFGGGGLHGDLEPALWTADAVRAVEEELAADRAFEACPAEDRRELLVEGAMERRQAHSVLNTPVTLPSTCTWEARIGS